MHSCHAHRVFFLVCLCLCQYIAFFADCVSVVVLQCLFVLSFRSLLHDLCHLPRPALCFHSWIVQFQCCMLPFVFCACATHQVCWCAASFHLLFTDSLSLSLCCAVLFSCVLVHAFVLAMHYLCVDVLVAWSFVLPFQCSLFSCCQPLCLLASDLVLSPVQLCVCLR